MEIFHYGNYIDIFLLLLSFALNTLILAKIFYFDDLNVLKGRLKKDDGLY